MDRPTTVTPLPPGSFAFHATRVVVGGASVPCQVEPGGVVAVLGDRLRPVSVGERALAVGLGLDALARSVWLLSGGNPSAEHPPADQAVVEAVALHLAGAQNHGLVHLDVVALSRAGIDPAGLETLGAAYADGLVASLAPVGPDQEETGWTVLDFGLPQPPVDQPPVDQPPADQGPADRPPADQGPAAVRDALARALLARARVPAAGPTGGATADPTTDLAPGAPAPSPGGADLRAPAPAAVTPPAGESSGRRSPGLLPAGVEGHPGSGRTAGASRQVAASVPVRATTPTSSWRLRSPVTPAAASLPGAADIPPGRRGDTAWTADPARREPSRWALPGDGHSGHPGITGIDWSALPDLVGGCTPDEPRSGRWPAAGAGAGWAVPAGARTERVGVPVEGAAGPDGAHALAMELAEQLLVAADRRGLA